jgi:hypothetical protein
MMTRILSLDESYVNGVLEIAGLTDEQQFSSSHNGIAPKNIRKTCARSGAFRQ